MCSTIQHDLIEEGLRLSSADLEVLQSIFNSYHQSNSLEDEILEFFREVAALQGKSVDETIAEMKLGAKKYREAININIEFKNDLPTDIGQYVEKLEKFAQGIERCWDIFSVDSKRFFILKSDEFLQIKQQKFRGFKGFIITLRLIFDSLKYKNNLFSLYKQSFLLIPKAVNRSIKLRHSKQTEQLQKKAQLLQQQVYKLENNSNKSIFNLSNLGKDTEDQIRKNQPAMAWAKARLEELEKIRSQQNV